MPDSNNVWVSSAEHPETAAELRCAMTSVPGDQDGCIPAVTAQGRVLETSMAHSGQGLVTRCDG